MLSARPIAFRKHATARRRRAVAAFSSSASRTLLFAVGLLTWSSACQCQLQLSPSPASRRDAERWRFGGKTHSPQMCRHTHSLARWTNAIENRIYVSIAVKWQQCRTMKTIAHTIFYRFARNYWLRNRRPWRRRRRRGKLISIWSTPDACVQHTFDCLFTRLRCLSLPSSVSLQYLLLVWLWPCGSCLSAYSRTLRRRLWSGLRRKLSPQLNKYPTNASMARTLHNCIQIGGHKYENSPELANLIEDKKIF